MNRRNYLKWIVAFGGLTLTSVPIIKLLKAPDPINARTILDKRLIITELAEMIIPETSTPGAKSAAVGDYIIKVLLNCTDPKQQHRFLSGIEDLEEFTRSTFGADFLDCSPKERHVVLLHFSEEERFSYGILNKIENKFFGKPFFVKLRDLTVEGYCLSQVGATQGLAYDYIPGSYDSCIPLNPIQKSWATK
jgi:hypothetical protein